MKFLNFKRGVCGFELFLIILSVVSLSFFISLNFVSAETKQDINGKPIEVTKTSNGEWVDNSGNIYVEDDNGRLVLKGNEDSGQTSSSSLTSNSQATSTLNPTNYPTGSLSQETIQSVSPGENSPMSALGGFGAGGFGASAASTGDLSSPISMLGSLIKGPIGEALIWGGVMFGVGMAVASVFGGKPRLVESVAIAAGVGAFGGKLIQHYFNLPNYTAMLIGAGIGFAVFMLIYEDVKYEAVYFQCMPWQAPIGASSSICEKCNDPSMPCSEYRCKSLGQTCELVNAGTSEERCINVNPKDVKPPVITPYEPELTKGYIYKPKVSSPPGPGIRIVRNNPDNSCVEAFTPIRFGIKTDEPAQCKIDFNSTDSFDKMAFYMGRSNLFKYIHYEQLVLPNAKDLENSTIQLRNGNEMVLYIRCRDKLGNTNEAEYEVSFCVDPSPDTTPPRIAATSMDNEGCIPATTDSAVVDFYINEPSECRWDREDMSYDLMKNKMVCSTKLFQMNAMQLYTCSANLTGVTRNMTDFYIRCRDQPGKKESDRNTNQESFKFSLRGSNQLKIKTLLPNSTIYGGVSPFPVDLYVETLFGCEKGKAICYFSDDGKDYIMFSDTNKEDGIHTQRLYLTGGFHKYFIKCVDSGGNLVEDIINFTLDIDTSSPIIARVYNDAGQLKIVTLRDSECAYSFDNCDFLFEEGVQMPKENSKVHFTDWNNEKTYYIKCRDKYRDLTADCSAIVRPIKLFY